MEKLKQKWLEQEIEGNENIPTKTPLTMQQTLIGFATEYKEEFDCLEATGNDRIIFTDRASIPNMEVLVGTQTVFQPQGNLNLTLNFHTSSPYSCPPCQMDPSDKLSCVYKDDHNIDKVKVCEKIKSQI